ESRHRATEPSARRPYLTVEYPQRQVPRIAGPPALSGRDEHLIRLDLNGAVVARHELGRNARLHGERRRERLLDDDAPARTHRDPSGFREVNRRRLATERELQRLPGGVDAEDGTLAHPAPFQAGRRVVFVLVPAVSIPEDDTVRGLRIELLDGQAGRIRRHR